VADLRPLCHCPVGDGNFAGDNDLRGGAWQRKKNSTAKSTNCFI
jgi:hypothetical protein